MDLDHIKNERIAERYLAGELLLRDARVFEQYCREHPQYLTEPTTPPELKTQLTPTVPTPHNGATTLSEDEFDDSQTEPSETSLFGRLHWVLSVGLLVAAILLTNYAWRVNAQEKQIKALKQQAKALQTTAPSSIKTYRVTPSKRGVRGAPILNIGWPNPPQFLDLHIAVTDSKFNIFQITIDKADEARILQILRVTRDSNKELRLMLNSSAFGPGEYHLKLKGYNWRGQLSDEGSLRLQLQ